MMIDFSLSLFDRYYSDILLFEFYFQVKQNSMNKDKTILYTQKEDYSLSFLFRIMMMMIVTLNDILK